MKIGLPPGRCKNRSEGDQLGRIIRRYALFLSNDLTRSFDKHREMYVPWRSVASTPLKILLAEQRELYKTY